MARKAKNQAANQPGFKPRPKQQEVLNYAASGGWMGVAAVPGSGKTRTLSALAAELIRSGKLQPDQEVLIVTLVNSAVDHFARQINALVQQQGLLPGMGYRVRTLHGLANDIVRERPALVGLDEGFQIIDEQEADEILQDAAMNWVRNNPNSVDAYISPHLTENEYTRVRNRDWQDEVINICRGFIKQAKDRQLMPEEVRRGLDRFGQPLPLAEMCLAVYVAYQRGLVYRGAVDFQDLIRLGLRALELDKDYLNRLRQRWVYILEDEAQDSSKLQEQILRTLVGERGNWVRVGDPNQAIYETFTTAKPEYLRDFLRERGVKSRELPNSGRSTKSIIRLANELIEFAGRHPSGEVKARLPLQPPMIEPTPRGDPQPNPEDAPEQIHIRMEDYSPAVEVETVVRSARQWITQNSEQTAAVLVPRNDRGAEVAAALKKQGVEVVELLRSTSSTRETAGALSLVFEHLTQPLAAASLAGVYLVWRRDDRENPEERERLQAVVKALRGFKQVEAFLQPVELTDWREVNPALAELLVQDEGLLERLELFQRLLRRWHAAVLLPVDQLILTVAQDLFSDETDLAIAYSLAVVLRHDADLHPDWRLPQFAGELVKIARNKRRVAGLSADDTGFDPDAHRGKVTVATMHRAKGLEWDRVYLMSINNYDFPSDEPQDTYISEKWFVRDGLNLQEEALQQLRVLSDPLAFEYVEGEASREARLDYVGERLRLLYVGITRARRELVITWNTGRDGKRQPAVPVIALYNYLETRETGKKKK